MDRAQTLRHARRARRPELRHNGNHDPLVQGNEDRRGVRGHRDRLPQGRSASTVAPGPGHTDPAVLLEPPLSPSAAMLVPPDPVRRFVGKPQIKAVYGANGEDNATASTSSTRHEDTASNDAASYYAWDPPRRPASASSRSTRSPRAASVGAARLATETSTTRSSSG